MRCGGIAAAAALAMLAGCATRDVKPSEAEMDKVEAALAAQPCIKDIAQWQRQYYYHAKYFGEEVEDAAQQNRAPRSSGHVRHIIGFIGVQQADLPPGRGSLAQPPQASLADAAGAKEARRAEGSYDLRSGMVNMARCDTEKRINGLK